MDELNDNTDDEDHDDNKVETSSMNNETQKLLIQRSAINYSEITSEFASHEVKTEPV
jgi:hypothetical protein